MAQRFGRNQRRRMREALAAQVSYTERVLMHAAQKEHDIAEVESVLDEARYILGNSVALPPTRSGIELRDGQRSFSMAPNEPMDDFLRSTRREPTVIKVQMMHALLVKVESSLIEPGLHVHVQLGSGEWAYAISEQDLHRMPADALRYRLERELNRQLADAMVKHIRNPGSR